MVLARLAVASSGSPARRRMVQRSLLPAVLVLAAALLPVLAHASSGDGFHVVNILPTTPGYEGVSTCVSCDGSQCCSSVWGCPNLWGVVVIGNASMDPNVWGWQDRYTSSPGSIGNGSSVMKIAGGRVVTRSVWLIKSRPLYNVMAYHEVIYGAKPWGNQPVNAPGFTLPEKVSELPRILVGVDYKLYSGRPGNNFAFEAWLFRDPNNGRAPGAGDYEIMVQLYIDGGYPAGYEDGPKAVYTVPILVDGRLVNQTFELYDVVTDAGWRFLTFKSTTNYVNRSVVFDYTLFIELADSYLGGVLGDKYLMSLEFGTEVYTNRCTSFPCQVNVTWSLDRYYYALAPRELPPLEALKAWMERLNGSSGGGGGGEQPAPPSPSTPAVELWANATSVPPGSPVNVSWSIRGAEGWESNIAASGNGSRIVKVNTTTTFYIYAWSSGGSVNKTLTITVEQQGGQQQGENTIHLSYPEDGDWPTATIDLDGDGEAEYVIEINPWNIESASGSADMYYYKANHTLHYVQHLENIVLRNPGAWVHGYPEIYVGNKPWNQYAATDAPVPLPGRLSSLSNFRVTVSYRLNPEPGLPVNLAIESWLTRDRWRTSGVGAGEQELMIWLYYNGLQPAGQKLGEVVIPITVNGSRVNATFEVWRASLGWEYIAFRLKNPVKAGTVSLEYAPFISVAANITGIDNYTSLYLEDVEVGTEYGSPSTTSASLEWWITGFTLEPLNGSLVGEPPAQQPPEENPAPPPPQPPAQREPANGSLEVELVNSWGSGAQYSIRVHLDTAAQWKLLVKVADGSIADAWGAKPAGSTGDGYTVLVAEDWNQGPDAEAGLITSGSNPLLEQVLLVAGGRVLYNWTAPSPGPGQLQASLTVESDWGTGFVAKIRLTNNGDTPVAGWKLLIRMTSSVTSIWGAEIVEQSGDTLLLGPASYDNVIQPGQTVELGFVAAKSGSHPYPEIVAVQG